MSYFYFTQTCLYNFDPLKPHFYIKHWGLQEYTKCILFFLISAQKHRLWVLVRTMLSSSNEYPQSMFWAEIWKIRFFLSEMFQFLEVKFSICLNRCIFLMMPEMSFRFTVSDWHTCYLKSIFMFSYFSMKTYVLGSHWNHIDKGIPMSAHNIIMLAWRNNWCQISMAQPSVTKTCLYNFDPLKPHFYIVKLGFTRVHIIFLISAQKHRLWVFIRTVLLRWF